LADKDSDVRRQAARTLEKWGQQETALPALIGLLAHEDRHVRRQAAETLRHWGPEARRSHRILQPVCLAETEAIGNWLCDAVAARKDQDHERKPLDPEFAGRLTQCLSPQEGEPKDMALRREILANWCWSALNAG
jgi:hypothetical protein